MGGPYTPKAPNILIIGVWVNQLKLLPPFSNFNCTMQAHSCVKTPTDTMCFALSALNSFRLRNRGPHTDKQSGTLQKPVLFLMAQTTNFVSCYQQHPVPRRPSRPAKESTQRKRASNSAGPTNGGVGLHKRAVQPTISCGEIDHLHTTCQSSFKWSPAQIRALFCYLGAAVDKDHKSELVLC